ncbi:MAG TPA: exodeoxyribonuclease VII large subunit, partial [Terriglobales bacterium]|nr:exodeoxyribonuclease VII large subunit [Terriglobales bacterium]
ELWAFNDEGVARAIAACKVPVISAVGHETDFTIADFAADLRAPTPSAAAELSVPDTMTLKTRFANLDARLLALVRTRLQSARTKVADLASRRVFKSPAIYIDDRRMAVVAMTARLEAAMRLQEARRRRRLEVAAGKLDALSPLAVLGRGYSVILREGAAVRARTELSPGDKIEIMFAKGGANATVTEVYDGK